jgi:hypothetical protein
MCATLVARFMPDLRTRVIPSYLLYQTGPFWEWKGRSGRPS